jgi:class 3 adenylate cyclase
MKRALLGTLWVGTVAAGLALALQISGLLARPAAALGKTIPLPPNDLVGFGNLVFAILRSFAVAWTFLQVTGATRRALLIIVLLLELIGAAWVLQLYKFNFPPLPAIVAVAIASALAIRVSATRAGRQRRATAQAFAGRLAPAAIARLTESEPLNLFEPGAHEVSFVFCEIANAAELIDDLPPATYAQLTGEFIDCARKRFLEEGGYLQAADGEGIRVLFGFPKPSPRHAVEAATAALAFREEFRAAAAARPESLGKGDLRIGISSGTVIASLLEDSAEREIVVAGEPFELARRLARANQVYGSEILLGPRTFSAAGKEIVARPIDFLRNTEAHDQLEVYELLALAENASAEEIARRDRFWTAIVYFRERRWDEALAEFNRAAAGNGASDRPLQWYLRRLEPLCLQTPPQPAPRAEPLLRL